MPLRIRKIEKVYPEFRLELDFQVRPGELLILLGPSGCGKTTTLRMVAGFIPPDSGSLLMNGRRIDTLPPHKRRIGIVFQDYALFPHLNVRDNVAFGLRMHGWSRSERIARVEQLLDLVALRGYENRKVTRLSGGEQQRVALARALAPQPQLLLLDEPLSALDAKMRGNLRAEIRRIQRELAITTLYVTHDQEEALVLGDRIAVMRGGAIEQIDTPENVYNRPGNLFVGSFLGQANLLRGRLSERRAEQAVVRTPAGKVVARLETDAPFTVGQPVVVFFRPEHCLLHGDAPDSLVPPNLFSARVLHREYLGSHQLVEAERDDQRFLLDLSDRKAPASGEVIRFSVPPEDCCLFPDNSGGK